MAEVEAVAAAVTEIVKAGERIGDRRDLQEARLETAVADLRSPLPEPAAAPAPSSEGHRWLIGLPSPAAMYVAEVSDVEDLGHDDLRNGFSAKLLETLDAAIGKCIPGPVGIAFVIYPAGVNGAK